MRRRAATQQFPGGGAARGRGETRSDAPAPEAGGLTPKRVRLPPPALPNHRRHHRYAPRRTPTSNRPFEPMGKRRKGFPWECPRICVGLSESHRHAFNQRQKSCSSECLNTVWRRRRAARRVAGAPFGVEPRSQISEQLVDDAVDRAKLRSMADRPGGDRISDEVIDELLAGARTEQEIAPGHDDVRSTRSAIRRS
jgi:hypothetical protein